MASENDQDFHEVICSFLIPVVIFQVYYLPNSSKKFQKII